MIGLLSCSSAKADLSLAKTGKGRWFVASAPALKDALYPLAAKRLEEGRRVVWIEANSSSILVANLSKHHAGDKPGDCLILVGAPADWTDTPRRFRQVGGIGTTERMKGIASDAALTTSISSKLAIGRLPARNPDELKLMVKKLLRYESALKCAHRKRKAVCITANPMAGSNGIWFADRLIGTLSKRGLSGIGTRWNVQGAADIQGHLFETTTSEFPLACEKAISSPFDMLLYFGHSDEEMLFSRRSTVPVADYWRSLPRSDEKGLFFTAGCMAFSDAESYGVCAIRSPGGPAASIGPVGKSYATFAHLAGKAMVEGTQTTSTTTIGDWWMQMRSQFSSGKISPVLFRVFDHFDGSKGGINLAMQRREHLEMWQLYGDPAMLFPP